MLDMLTAQGVVGGVEIAARYLPSVATQLGRRSNLPEPDELSMRVEEAQDGLPFRAGAFRPFIDDVTTSRTMPPLLLSDISDGLIAARLQPLLFPRGHDLVRRDRTVGYSSAGAFLLSDAGCRHDLCRRRRRGERDRGRVTPAQPGAGSVSGALAALVTVAVGLREPLRIMRVAGAIAGAVLMTVAILTVTGVRLSLIHIVSLQFVAGVGLDYALFFARRQLDDEERARTLWTLITCNAMTVLTFGLLAVCRTPLLRQIGATVVMGAVAALVFAFLFVGRRPGASARFT